MSTQGPNNGHGGFVFYYYEPSVAAAGIFTAIFFLSSLLHAFQIVRTKTWYFIPMVVGGLMESAGYIGRIMSHYEPNALRPYILQTVLLLIAPALFAASIYMILGRLVIATEGQEYSVIKPSHLTKVFVSGDVCSFLVQSVGAGLLVSGKELRLGEDLILAGLVLQVIFFGIFVIVAFIFHVRMNKTPTVAARVHEEQAVVSWRKMLWVLYAASFLIVARSVFRLVEYAEGNDGYLMRSEAWLYLFDALLMAITIQLFNYYHPSKSGFQERREETKGKPEGSPTASV